MRLPFIQARADVPMWSWREGACKRSVSPRVCLRMPQLSLRTGSSMREVTITPTSAPIPTRNSSEGDRSMLDKTIEEVPLDRENPQTEYQDVPDYYQSRDVPHVLARIKAFDRFFDFVDEKYR